MSHPPPDQVTATLDGGPSLGFQPLELPDRWRVLRQLGQGGQAEVWLAEDLRLGEKVAIKVYSSALDSVQSERLRREVTLGRRLLHSGLVRVFELVDAGGRPALVLEWMRNGSLADRLEVVSVEIDEVERVAAEALDVLSHLHGENVAHRDVKPSNILFDDKDRVHLSDLGLARSLTAGGTVTKSEQALGTIAYMSPEQFRGEEPSASSDLFSLGVTLFHMVTGRLPWSGVSDFDMVARRFASRRVPAPRRLRKECPVWLNRFILRLMEPRPENRFLTASAALTALRRRRTPVSPRRIVASLAVLGASIALSAMSLWLVASLGQVPARAMIVKGELVALTADGMEVWRRPVENTRSSVLVADIADDSKPEVILGIDRNGSSPEILVYSSSGQLRYRVDVDLATLTRAFPEEDRNYHIEELLTGDLDGDGRPELLWFLNHGLWYPSALQAWSPRSAQAPHALFVNSGHIQDVELADLDGDDDDEIVLVAINNPLGYQAIAVGFDPRPPGASGFRGIPPSPDLLASWISNANQPRVPFFFTPLGWSSLSAHIASATNAGVVIGAAAQNIRLDENGNPPASAALMVGRGQRISAWDDLTETCLQITTTGQAPSVVYEQLKNRHAAVFTESGMDLAATLLLSRSLASAGLHDQAIERLRIAASRYETVSDLWLRLGEQLLIVGRRREGREALTRSIVVDRGGRNPLDAQATLAMDAIRYGDRDGMQEIERQWLPAFSTFDLAPFMTPIWAMFQGDWENPALDDPPDLDKVPEARIAFLWAQLQRGAPLADVKAEARTLADDGRLRPLAMIVVAAAELAGGQPRRALATARNSRSELAVRCRTSASQLAWLALAEHLIGEAVDAVKGPGVGRPHHLAAAGLAPGAWFAGPTVTNVNTL